MSDTRNTDDLTRADFLKLAGLAAAVPFLSSVSSASAADGGLKDRIYVVTHSDDDVDRAALALILAGMDAKKIGKEVASVTIWFTLAGGRLARKGGGDAMVPKIYRKFGTLGELLTGAIEAGVKVAACPPCVDYLEIPKDSYVKGLERKGGDYLTAMVGKADIIWM